MKSFRQYLHESQEDHPHYQRSDTDGRGITKHTYEDSEKGVRTFITTHPDRPGTADWGFITQKSNGDWNMETPTPEEKKSLPTGRTESSLRHVADFVQRSGVDTITFNTADGSPNEDIFKSVANKIPSLKSVNLVRTSENVYNTLNLVK
jgi:hypothetical protein